MHMEQIAMTLGEKTTILATVRPSRTTFKVHTENLDSLRDRIDSLNRRVALLVKRGHDVAAVKIQVGELYVEQRQVWDEREHKSVTRESVYANVELLTPKPPKVDGWELVAALTHVAEVGTVLRVCPGAEVADGELKRYREALSDNCDHCGYSRKRSDTFVIRAPGGELRQVGRQCLASYTGLANPGTLCAAAEILFAVSEVLSSAEDDNQAGRGGGYGTYASIARYLPYVACSIRVDGWLSRTTAREQGRLAQATADLAYFHGLFPAPKDEHPYVPEERDFNLASATIAFCEERFTDCDVDKLSDYESSLRVAMASGILHPKFWGIVASAIGFYKRDVERRARNTTWAEMATKSRHQGVVGERRVFEGLRVMACRSWASDYGVKYFYAMVDEECNSYSYFATRDMGLEEGQAISVHATVKKHEMYTPKWKDAPTYPQTLLTRCSLVARARVASVEVVEKYLGKSVVKNSDQVELGLYVEREPVMEKVNVYHLVGLDDRRFVFSSKSRKKAMLPGTEWVVSYDVEDLSKMHDGERPVSIVSDGKLS